MTKHPNAEVTQEANEEKEYRVTWEIDITAKSAEEAAQIAAEIQKRPFSESIAHVYKVKERGTTSNEVLIDLDEKVGKGGR